MNSKQKKPVESKQNYSIITAISLAFLAFVLIKSPIFSFDFYNLLDCGPIQLPGVVKFEGNLSPNKLLEEKAFRVGENVLVGPETIVFDKDGYLYTGLLNGQIVKVDVNNGYKHTVVTQMGPESQEVCNNVKTHAKAECGRPLGIRLKDKNSSILYVADAYFGIFKVDLKTGSKQIIVSSDDKRFGDKPMKLVNDLDMDGDIIYFIDSSYKRAVSEAIEEHGEARPRGRLFSFNEKTNELKLLLENLYFPNGLQLMPDKNTILINENTMSRIIKYHLTGEKKGQVEVFAVIPGFGDTIRLTDYQTILAPIAAVRGAGFAAVLDLLGAWPRLRNVLGFILNMKYLFRVFPKYGLIVEYDLHGNVLRSWHDPSGKVVECTTAGAIHDNKLYMGSFYNPFLAVVDYNN